MKNSKAFEDIVDKIESPSGLDSFFERFAKGHKDGVEKYASKMSPFGRTKRLLLGLFILVIISFLFIVQFSSLFVSLATPVLAFPFTAAEEALGIDLGIGSGVGGGSLGGSGSKGVAGARYTWDELAKLNTVSDPFLQNLYKFCMCHYQAQCDLGQDQTMRLDAPMGFFLTESGSFSGARDILTDYTNVGAGAQYQGIYCIDYSYPFSSSGGGGKWDWARYKHPSGRSVQYVPDAIYWTITASTGGLTDNYLVEKSGMPYHNYGTGLRKACAKYGINYDDPKVQNSLGMCYLYLGHAGGIFEGTYGDLAVRYRDASADFYVCLYSLCGQDFSNLECVRTQDVFANSSWTVQRCGIGDQSVYSPVWGGSVTYLSCNTTLGLPSELKSNPVFNLNGQPLDKSLLQLYAENSKSPECVATFNELGQYTYATSQQAIMATTVGAFLPSLGQAIQLEALQAVGYSKSDIVFDDLGYACFKKAGSTVDNSIGGKGDLSFVDNKWAAVLVGPNKPSYTTLADGNKLLDVFCKDSVIGSVATASKNATAPGNKTAYGSTIITAGGAVPESQLASGKITEVPNSFLTAMVSQMKSDIGSSFGGHSGGTGMGYRTFYQASYSVDGSLQVSQQNGYWARTLGQYSEHCLGLAVDFDISYNNSGAIFGTGLSNRSGGADANKEFKWLADNAHKYGFIWRYKIDGSDTSSSGRATGTIYEGWHWRFVGVYNATQFWKKCSSDGKTGYNTNDSYVWEDYYYENISGNPEYPQTTVDAFTNYYNATKGNKCTYSEYVAK